MATHFSVIILAAGQSSRMGVDKAELNWQGLPLWRRQIQFARELGADDILLSHPRHGQADLKPGFGPLSGLHTLLPQCLHNTVLVLPIDMPLLTPKLLTPLLAHQNSAYFAQSALPCVLKHNPTLHAYIASQLHEQGRRSVQSLLTHCQADAISCAEPERLINANTPEQWQNLMQNHSMRKVV